MRILVYENELAVLIYIRVDLSARRGSEERPRGND
jgi:hypothetical protein